MKELLRITHLRGDVCEIKVDLQDEGDGEQLASAILGILGKGGEARVAIMAAVATETVVAPAEHGSNDCETEEVGNRIEGAKAVAKAPHRRIGVARILVALRENDSTTIFCHENSF